MKRIIIYLTALIAVVVLSFLGKYLLQEAILTEEEKIEVLNDTYSKYMEDYVNIDEYANYADQYKNGLKNINDILKEKNVLIN